MNILLTGATGFLGSVLTHFYIKKGLFVFGVIRGNSDTSRIQDILSYPHFKPVSPSSLEKTFKENAIEAVVHTATSYGREGEDISQINEANIELPLRILNLAISNGTKIFVNSDTFLTLGDEKQKNRDYIYTKKEFIKRAREILTPTISFVNMKIEQMYGPNDNPTKFIPFLIKEFLSEKERIPLNPGFQKRDYIYIDDVAEIYYKILVSKEKLENFEEIGVGSGKTNTLQDLVNAIKKASGSRSIPGFGDIPYHQYEIMESVADTKNHSRFGWSAHIDLESGIAKTVDYYKNLGRVS